MNKLSSTFQNYKKNYKISLSSYLESYEDNTEVLFLENELNDYNEYNESLKKILDYFKTNKTKDLKINSEISNVISDLKQINELVFNEIFTLGKTKIVTDKVTLENGFEDELIRGYIPPSIDINFQKLNNYIASAKKILDFIGKEYTISRSPNKNAAALYLTGELPQVTTKLESSVPEKELVVNSGANNDSEKSVDTNQSDLNEYRKSTIESCLSDIVDDINPIDYKILADALYSYFTTGEFPKLQRIIMFNDVNKKKVGWTLKKIYKQLKRGALDIEYFSFAKNNINLFNEEVIENINFRSSRFYKYFTTNPDN